MYKISNRRLSMAVLNSVIHCTPLQAAKCGNQVYLIMILIYWTLNKIRFLKRYYIYSLVSNKRGGSNKRVHYQILGKLINVEDLIFVEGYLMYMYQPLQFLTYCEKTHILLLFQRQIHIEYCFLLKKSKMFLKNFLFSEKF